MRSNKEIREEAWKLVWTNKNFFKLIGVSVLHFVILFSVLGALTFAMMGMSEPARSLASVFVNVLGGIFQGVVALGLTAMTLALVSGAPSPYRESFLGYSYPFRAFFAQLVLGFVISLWMLPCALMAAFSFSANATALFALSYFVYVVVLFVISYRYRFFWFVKAENPSSGAFEAVRTAVKMSEGHRLALFKFDLSYWLSALWLLVPIVGGCIFLAHWSLGAAIFYRDLRHQAD